MSKREAVAVTLVSVLVLVPVMIGLYLFPANASFWTGIPGCPNESPVASGSLNLTPSDPVLMQRCEVLSFFHGIQFTVSSAVDLRGSYVTNLSGGWGSIGLDAVAPNGQETWYWSGYAGRLESSVSFDVPVFPGTYVFFASGACGAGSCNTGYVIATEPIVAQFDRTVQTTSVPGNLTVDSSAYEAWPVSAPPNSSDVFVMDGMTTTACQFVLAILPPLAFLAFEASPGDFDFPNATVLTSDDVLSCPTYDFPMPVGPLVYGPLNLTFGSELVFYNSGGTDGYLWSGPLEVSWLTASPS